MIWVSLNLRACLNLDAQPEHVKQAACRGLCRTHAACRRRLPRAHLHRGAGAAHRHAGTPGVPVYHGAKRIRSTTCAVVVS